jgi:uncharacterized protein DUF262
VPIDETPAAEDLQVLDEAAAADEVVPRDVRYTISSYGADPLVDGLVKRIKEGDIEIPEFQRNYVWTKSQASRFIESLLLGLPVPNIFLAKDPESKKSLVVDGQQRLLTLYLFFEEKWPTAPFKVGEIKHYQPFKLVGVNARFDSRTYTTLDESDRRALDDSVIHTITVRQEQPPKDLTGIYQIFERLNTGGTRLFPQEIRACIYSGNINKVLADFNKNESWRKVYGKESRRMKDRELILRFFMLLEGVGDYHRPMEDAINKFMSKNRHLTDERRVEWGGIWESTIRVSWDALGESAFRPEKALNAAVFDSASVGIAHRLKGGGEVKPDRLREAYLSLLSNREYRQAYERSTSDDEQVKKRVRLAVDAFRGV